MRTTDKNDLIIGSIVEAAGSPLNTMSPIDRIDGGGGIDTVEVSSIEAITGMDMLASMKNIEILEVFGTKAVTLDTTAQEGLEKLEITRAVAVATDEDAVIAADLTAADTTNVVVSGVSGQTEVNGGQSVNITQDTGIAVASGSASITVNNAKDVTITATNSKVNPDGDDKGIVVEDATGAVNITATGAKYTAGGSGSALDKITVTGGTTVNVTQKGAASIVDAGKKAVSDDKIIQGEVEITATADTKEVTVKQEVVAGNEAVATSGGVTETATVTFKALKAGDTLGINEESTLTAVKDMTAAEVAQAFANLSPNAAFTNLENDVLAAGDTQGGAAYSKATYKGITNDWKSGAANGATVVFTSTEPNSDVTGDLEFTHTPKLDNPDAKPEVVTTQGKGNDVKSGGVVGIEAGTVTVINAAEVLETVTIDGYGSDSAVSGDASTLQTLNLSNGAAFTVGGAAADLALNLTDVSGAITISGGATTLNATVNHSNVEDTVTLISTTATETVNISGAGQVSGDAGDLSGATAINTSGMTDGTATFTIANGISTSYTGGAGQDIVTISNVSGDNAISQTINLGAGDDKLILGSGSEANVGLPTVELDGGEGTDTLSLNVASAAELSKAQAFAAKIKNFERLELNDKAVVSADVTVNLANLGFTDYVITSGTSGAKSLVLDNLANGGTVVLTDTADSGGITANIKDADTGEADVLNLVAEVTNEDVNMGLFTAADVESINITASDISPLSGDGSPAIDQATISLSANKVTEITVDGNADLVLGLAKDEDEASINVELTDIDASSLTGKLTVDLTEHNGEAVTITGGNGGNVLSASIGENAVSDKLIGGAANDILYAGSNGAVLTGGAGNDLFVLAAAEDAGNLEINTYSTITDFSQGDLLKLESVESFAKLTSNLDESTAVFSNFANAAIKQADGDGAVWFSFKGDSYVVVDRSNESDTFTNGQDQVIKLAGVADLDNASFNTDYGTVELFA